jgi:ornithine decarboxylase
MRTFLTSDNVKMFIEYSFFNKINTDDNDNDDDYDNDNQAVQRWFFDKKAIINQIDKWNKQLSWIRPYYAMKANTSTELLNTLVHYGKNINIGLDVASLLETKKALQYVDTKRIIYTNPHFIPYEKPFFTKTDIHIKVVDNMMEMKKITDYGIFPDILIRLKSNIYDADCKFDSKFGCNIDEAIRIIEYAKSNKIHICGISFHIGSGGEFNRKIAYQKAIEYAKPILDKIENPILDIGGGLLYDTDLHEALGWTKDLPYQLIAEPGRYFAEPSYHLAIQIISKTERGVFLDNGVYQELNVYHRDHWKFPVLTHYYDHETNMIHKITDYITIPLFGPTCDSYDVIPSVTFPTNIQTNDWIFLSNMGAYTSAGAVNFNGVISASNSHLL